MMKKILSAVCAVSMVASFFVFPERRIEASDTVIFITDTSQTSWTVPSDWNNSSNSIEVIGGGAGGDYAYGGGGGAYSKSNNVTLTPGSTVGIQVGEGGVGGTGGGDGTAGEDTWLCNSTSNCASISGTAVVVGAKAGTRGNAASDGNDGGAAASGVGDVKYSGGSGGYQYDIGFGQTGGGGSGGPNGNGGAGGWNRYPANGQPGGGGGGGGTAGGDYPGSGFGGGCGGNNYLGAGGGGCPWFAAGGDGSAGGGGGGSGLSGNNGGNGGNGEDWDSTHGSGGGGGAPEGGAGGDGGLYGGGGAGNGGGSGGDGAQGIIVITYTPASGTTRTTLSKPVNNLGLVGYWSFNENSGTKVGDYSGKGRFGTISNSVASWTSGKLGGALNFGSGFADYATISASDTDFLGALSISAWIYATDSGDNAIISKVTSTGATAAPFDFQLSSAKKLYFVRSNTDYCARESVATVGSSGWHHVAVTAADGNIDTVPVFYIDGVASSANTILCNGSGAATGGSYPIKIGKRDDGSGQVDGKLDEIRVYNRALTATEVAALASQKAVVVGGGEKNKARDGLVGHWTFNGSDINWSSASAGTAYDRVGGHNAAITNMYQATSTAPGKMGQALYFDGNDDYVQTTSAFGVTTLNATIMAWVKGVKTSANTGIVYSRDSGNGIGISYDAHDHLSYTWNTNDIATWGWESGLTIPQNQWALVAVAIEPTKATAYVCTAGVCNQSINSITHISQTFAGALEIGRDSSTYSDRHFLGSIDDVRFYTRTLSADEIKSLYSIGSGVKILSN